MRKQITVDGVTSNTINAHQVAPDLKRNGEGEVEKRANTAFRYNNRLHT